MAATQNPPGFNADTFSPAPRQREASFQEIVDNATGFEPQATATYRFKNKTFVELQPYDDIQ